MTEAEEIISQCHRDIGVSYTYTANYMIKAAERKLIKLAKNGQLEQVKAAIKKDGKLFHYKHNIHKVLEQIEKEGVL